MNWSPTSTALESLARLRTMRALFAGEDRVRFERLVSDVEQTVGEIESVTVDLARMVATRVTTPIDLKPVDLSDMISRALRNVDAALASRGVLVDIVAPPAVFVMTERERLEQLCSTALLVAASAVTPQGHASVRYGPRDARTVDLSVSPYCVRDPRAVIVDALAQSLNMRLSATDDGLCFALPAAIDAQSV